MGPTGQSPPPGLDDLCMHTEVLDYKGSPGEPLVLTSELGTWLEASSVRQQFRLDMPLSTNAWPAETVSFIKAAQDFSLECLGSEYPTTLFLAKAIAFYDVEVRASKHIGGDIEVIEGRENPLNFSYTARGTTTQESVNFDETVDEALDMKGATLLWFRYEEDRGTRRDAQASQLRVVGRNEDTADKGRYTRDVDSSGTNVFRIDSLLSVLSIMRGLPKGPGVFFPLLRGQQCQPMTTDEAVCAQAYCYGSLESIRRVYGGQGKFTASSLPPSRKWDTLSEFLSMALPTVWHASTFKAGPGSGSKLSQWGKSGFLPQTRGNGWSHHPPSVRRAWQDPGHATCTRHAC